MEKISVFEFLLAGVTGAVSAMATGALIEFLRVLVNKQRRAAMRSRTFKENIRQALS